MPMVFKKEDEGSCTGLWEITEQAPFFESALSYRASATHPEKIRQQLAARMILHDFDIDFPFDNVEIAAGGKPVLKNQGIRFSLSHCNGFAAAIVSDQAEVGIDIEPIHQRVLKIEKNSSMQPSLGNWIFSIKMIGSSTPHCTGPSKKPCTNGGAGDRSISQMI